MITKNKQDKQSIYTALITIILFTLLTLADAPAPEPNVHNLFLKDGKVFAASGYYLFSSSDGGITWNPDSGSVFDYNEGKIAEDQLIIVPETNITYRINEDGDIEKSIDHGNSWQFFYEYQPLSSIDNYYYKVIKPDADQIRIPPCMLYEPVSGNIIITNQLAGIGVILKSGNYLPFQFGGYSPVKRQIYYDISVFKRLMGNYVLTDLFLFFLLLNFWMVFSREGFFRFVALISILTWILLVITSYNIPYVGIYYYFISIFMILIQLLLTVVHIQYFKYTLKPHWKITILFALIGSLLYLPPYLFWYFGFIELSSATLISYSLTFIWTVYIFKKYHSLVKEKNIGIWKDYKFTFLWKTYAFRVYRLTDEDKNDDKE
jgi:hypothetical protein